MLIRQRGFNVDGQVRKVSEAEGLDMIHYGLADRVDPEERGVTIAPLPSQGDREEVGNPGDDQEEGETS